MFFYFFSIKKFINLPVVGEHEKCLLPEELEEELEEEDPEEEYLIISCKGMLVFTVSITGRILLSIGRIVLFDTITVESVVFLLK